MGKLLGKDELASLERVPIVVPIESDKGRFVVSPCIDGPSRHDIHVAILERPTELVTATRSVPSHVIAPPCANEFGWRKDEFLTAGFGCVDQPHWLPVEPCSHKFPNRSRRCRRGERQIVSSGLGHGRCEWVSRQAVANQHQCKRNARIDDFGRRFKAFVRHQTSFRTRLIRWQEAANPPFGDQVPCGALGNAREPLHIARFEASSPEQHGFSKTACNCATNIHYRSNLGQHLQYLQVSLSCRSRMLVGSSCCPEDTFGMRFRLTAPRGESARIRYLDSLHAALINAWTASGAQPEQLLGGRAGNWSFGAVGASKSSGFALKSVVIGAEDGALEPFLQDLACENVRKSSVNGDVIDLSAWDLAPEELPIECPHGSSAVLPAIMLSPLAVSKRGEKRRWHDDLTKIGSNLEQAVSARLSRLTGRKVDLEVEPDRLYLRANPKHSTLVPTRTARGARPAFVIGTLCPLLIRGSIEDLRSAWALGIGEKNRYGFGCIGYAGQRA